MPPSPQRIDCGLRVAATSMAAMLSSLCASVPTDAPFRELARTYCFDCHNSERMKGDFDMEGLFEEDPALRPILWEDVVWMLEAREMPPLDEPDVPRPSDAEYAEAATWLTAWLEGAAPPTATPEPVLHSPNALVQEHCLNCHNAEDRKGELVLERLDLDHPTAHPEIAETVVRRLDARQMPPPDRKRPSEETYQSVLQYLIAKLDAAGAARPQPGRTATFRRLNRTEYRNAIRDLLGVEIDVSTLLPKDDASHGFDNVTVGTLSPTLLDRYITAAQKISRLALGAPHHSPQGDVFRIPAERTQEKRLEGLPLGTRGGALIDYTFPRDGVYEISVLLARDRNEHVEGLHGSHQLDVLLDRKLLQRFAVERPEQPERGAIDHSKIDQHLRLRAHIEAGPRQLGVTFVAKPYPVLETKRMPHNVHFNYHRHPRLSPAVYQISITGPYESDSPGSTPSRAKIFTSYPEKPSDELDTAKDILSNLIRRAYRRPARDEDLLKPLQFYRQGYQDGGFEAGIELALSSILVNPQFLFRIERDPQDPPASGVYQVGDIELASRLSFFIWSSIPDDELLGHAIAGRLSDDEVLESQIQRMLADPRSRSLVENFAGQWLYLRNLETVTPDLREYPDFDDNLRQAFRKETELFFESVLREDRPVTDLLQASYTYLNERLARHYEIPHILGSRFRRVELEPRHHRGGLLRHGSILTVTSYATRTSPTIRGNWILENIVGTPPPPPPPDVPTLEDNKVDQSLPMRERLAEHRANPACASCHDIMDPVGFVLENYDAVGRWRAFAHSLPIDATGSLPDGIEIDGIEQLETGLLERPHLFVRTLAEKLLIFALGRGVEPYDAPAVREIVAKSAEKDYRFSSLITAIAQSVPFQMRATEDPTYYSDAHAAHPTGKSKPTQSP